MLRMRTRQAMKPLIALLAILTGLSACSPLNQAIAVPNALAPTLIAPAAAQTSAPATIPSAAPTFTATPLACLTKPGRVEQGILPSSDPPQLFLIYLPRCYDQKTDERYPVLYLLHGQMSMDDQWVRIGAAAAADQLILAGGAPPFIIVFPDDRYWNLPSGPGFGQRLVEQMVPYIDANFRTFPDRDHRAIGGLSRGAGWALHLGLTRWDLFGAIGLHSLAVFQGDGPQIESWLNNIPPDARPRIFMDLGENDPELVMARQVEAKFNDFELAHEWHLYVGGHTEGYWSAHVQEYIQWYADGWNHP